VSTHNPSFIDIRTLNDAREEIRKIGSDPKSIEIMAPKALSKVIRFDNIVLQDAMIVKQDMLSLGGEVAIPKEVFELKEKRASILVMGTITQLQELVGKLNRHYSRIQTIAQELSLLLQEIR
jgi:dihydropteroate synthase